jgi:hypothetical protein
LFRMVPAYGRSAPRARARPAFNEKWAHMALFCGLWGPLAPKCYENVTNFTKKWRKFNKNLTFFTQN